MCPRWSLDRTSPGTTDLIYRDVFPGAIPFELLSNKLQGRVVHRHKFRRLTILSKVIFLTSKGVKRRVRLLRTGPILGYHRDEIERTPTGSRASRCWPVSRPARILHSFTPYPVDKSLLAGMKELDDADFLRALLDWQLEFRPCGRVEIIDVTLMLETLVRKEGQPVFKVLAEPEGKPGLRFQLLPLNLVGRTPIVKGLPDMGELLDLLDEDGDAVTVRQRMRLKVAEAAEPPRHWTLVVVDRLQRVLYFVDSTHEQHYRGQLPTLEEPGPPPLPEVERTGLATQWGTSAGQLVVRPPDVGLHALPLNAFHAWGSHPRRGAALLAGGVPGTACPELQERAKGLGAQRGLKPLCSFLH